MPRKRIPKKPKGLSKEAEKYWREICERLEGDRILKNETIMVLYAETFHQYKEATAELIKMGQVVKGANNKPIESPYKKIQKDAQTELTRLIKEFGGPVTTVVSLEPIRKARRKGRPSKYKPEYAEKMIEWFDQPLGHTEEYTASNGQTKTRFIPCELPTLNNFACEIGVTQHTLWEWSKATDDNEELLYPEFAQAYQKAKEHTERILVGNTMNGAYNTAFAIFTAKNILRWSDRQVNELELKAPKKITSDMTPQEATDIYLQSLNNPGR